jgi:hypothetical protein
MEIWRAYVGSEILKEDPARRAYHKRQKQKSEREEEEEEKKEKEKKEKKTLEYQKWYNSLIRKIKIYYDKLLATDMDTWRAQSETIKFFKEVPQIKAIEDENPGWLDFHFTRDVQRGSTLSTPRRFDGMAFGDSTKTKNQSYQGETYLTPFEKIEEATQALVEQIAISAGIGALSVSISRILGLVSKVFSKTKLAKSMRHSWGREPGRPKVDAANREIKMSKKVPRENYGMYRADGIQPGGAFFSGAPPMAPTPRYGPRAGGRPQRKDRLDIAQEDIVLMDNLSEVLDPSYDYYIHKVRYASKGQTMLDVNYAIREKGFLLNPARPTFGKISSAEEGLTSLEIARRIFSSRIFTNPGPKGATGGGPDNMVSHITNVYRTPRGKRPEAFAKNLVTPVRMNVPSRSHARGVKSHAVEYVSSVPFHPTPDVGVVAVLDARTTHVHLLPRLSTRNRPNIIVRPTKNIDK